MPYPIYPPEFDSFHRDLARLGFIQRFAWPDWVPRGLALQQDPDAMARADLTDLVKLLTWHIRAERFGDGHLANALQDGWLLAIMRRLQEISAELERDPERAAHLIANREAFGN
jgi:hypothetical protein